MSVSEEKEAEIRRLHYAEHLPVGTIATCVGVHHEVVERVLKLKERKVAPPRKKQLDPYADFIREQLERYPRLCATRLGDMLRQRGYQGSDRTVRQYVQSRRPAGHKTAYLRLETLCGEQAQIDWAHVGKVDVAGGQRALWVFVQVLSYSRGLWAELVFEQTASSLCRSLCRAATFFGGLPRQYLFDNTRAVVQERVGDATRFHPQLLRLCSELHVQPRLCAPRKPHEKGRVERSIRYLRDRFFAGRTLTADLAAGNRQLLEFVQDIAHKRPHPVLPGRLVHQVLSQEQQDLLPLPTPLPQTDLCIPVSVDKTAFICFDTNLYSVPPAHASSPLVMCASDTQIRLLAGDTLVAHHPRCWGRRQRIEDPAHRQQVLLQRRAAADLKGRDRLHAVAPQLDVLLGRWIQDGCNLAHMTHKTLKLLDLYGPELFSQAVQLIADRGTHDPSALAQVLEQLRHANKAPLPLAVPLGPHVPDRDVIPHDLESYDE